MKLLDKVQRCASDLHDEVVDIRRHIHMHPELSFEEVETSKFVASKLEEYGIQYQSDVADTGIVGLIKGTNSGKKVVALRADMDALPIVEENVISYKSKNEGVMHACGHDVHTSSLLGTARILSELKDEFEGTVKLIFQPAEERFPGGASLMIKAGALQNPKPQSIFGQHVYPDMEVGKVGFRAGKYMASADELYIKVIGQGGHAAIPNKVIDPVLIASHIVVALQQLVSRSANPFSPTVISFGRIVGNGATNIIPDHVMLDGTIRTMDEAWRNELHHKLTHMVTSIAEGMGGSAEIDLRKGYPFLINDEELTKSARAAAEEYLGKENVVDLPLRMGAEDFAYFSQEMPACFYRLGTSNTGKGIHSGLHTSTFNIDEDALNISTGLMTWLTLNELGK